MDSSTPDTKYFQVERPSQLVVNTNSPETFQSPLTTETEHSLQLSVTDDGISKLIKDSRSHQTSDVKNVDPHENSGQGSFTENESDEIADNHSVISEASVSLLSHQSFQPRDYTARLSYEKLVAQVKKLRKENVSLKEALNQANITDIMFLKTKLRGMQADLLRYRQLNNELKERIQLLEEKQFHLLTNPVVQSSSSKAIKNDNGTNGKNNYNELEDNDFSTVDDQSETISQKLKQQFQQRRRQRVNPVITTTDSSRIMAPNQDYLPINPNPPQNKTVSNSAEQENRDAFRAKLRHYEKLLRVYEKNMSMMQNEIDELKATKSTKTEVEKNFDDKRSTFLQPSDLMASPAVKDPTQNSIHVDDRQEAQKMVEFAMTEDRMKPDLEVKSLVLDENFLNKRYNQLSRDMKLLLEEYRSRDQKTITELANEVKRLTKILPKKKLEELDEAEEEMKETAPLAASDSSIDASAIKEFTAPIQDISLKSVPNENHHTYSVVHLLLAFCVGCFLMILWLSK